MSIENIGLQEITIVAGKEIPNQVAVQGDNAARGLSIKLLGSNHKIIKDPLIQVFWNYEIVTDDGVYTLDEPVEGRYSAGRYEVEYPSQLGAMSGIALAQVQFKQGLKTLYSIPYKIRVYKQVGQVGSSIPPGVVNIFDKALADALEELTQMSKDTKEYMVQTTSDVEAAFKNEMQLIFDGLESDVNELEFLIAKWESESTEYLNNLKAQGDKAVADLHVQLDETAEQLIDELRADLKIEYDKKQAEIDSITDNLVLQKAELEKLQERITSNTNTIEQLTVDFESKINQHIIDSDNKIDNHLSLYETKFTEYTTQSTQKIDQAIADMAGALDEDIERIVSEKVDEFADGLNERVNKTETDIVELETNKADRSELEGLAKETYVDEKIAAIPEVDLTDIENDISTLEEKKADKEEIPKYGNDLKVSEGWEVPLGSVVEGLNNFKADKTELNNKADKTELNNKADKTDLIGLATEKYVNDQISQIPEVDLTPINDDIDNLKESKANLVVKTIPPTVNDKEFNAGQMWYDKKSGDMYIFKGLDEDKLGVWSVFEEAGEISTFRFGLQGFRIDEGNTNPKTAVTYTHDSVGKEPAEGVNLNDWSEFVTDLATPLLLKNGQIQYELQHDDFTKKKDGSPSNLTGDDGDVMIRIPHIYVKETNSGNVKNVVLTDKPTDGFVSYTKRTEKGYNQLSWGLLMTLQHLYLLFYKDRDSQTALGRGSVDWESDDKFLKTGGTNSKPFCFGETSGKQQMKFLGIEDFWGNKTQWVDGLVSDSSYNGKVGYSNFNDNGSGYKTISTSNSSSLSDYFKNTQGNELGYLLKDDGTASSSTGYADYGYLSSGSVVIFGGSRSFGSSAGAFYVGVDDSASNAYSVSSARLCFVDDDYFYIGSYLGSEINGKLRSVSGQMPLGNKKIGECRTLAQANN